MTVGCEDERNTASGVDLVLARGAADRQVDDGLDHGVAAATVAASAAAVGVVAGLLPGAAAAAATVVASGFALAALLALALTGYLRPEAALVDMRYGFWLALVLVGGAYLAAGRSRRALAAGGRTPARRLAAWV